MLRLPKDVPLLDLPNDWKTPAIGTPSDVRALLEREFPTFEHTDEQMLFMGEAFWIEFNYRMEPEIGSVESIGVRSNAGPGAMLVMKRACEILEVSMIDVQTGDIADFSDQTENSLTHFSKWRGRTIDQLDDQ